MSGTPPLRALLERLRAALLARDADAAEQLTAATVRLVQHSPRCADEGVRALLTECDALATAFHDELRRALQGSATSSRAARSYERAEEAR